MIVVDTSFVCALLNSRDNYHGLAARWCADISEQFVTTPLVIAELDYLLSSRAGTKVLKCFWHDLAEGAYIVDWWQGAVKDSLQFAKDYQKLELGLTDASLLALMKRLKTDAVATFDERHFRTVKAFNKPLKIYPFDAV